MKNTIKEFKDFITTGNLIGIAIGILMGVEVSKVISSFVENLFTPIFALIGGKPTFRDVLVITVNDANFRLGSFLTDALNFVIVGFVAFLLVKAASKLFPAKEQESGPTEIELLTQIRDSLQK